MFRNVWSKAGLRNTFLIGGVSLVAVLSIQWWSHQVRDLRCVKRLKALERTSLGYLEVFAAALDRQKDQVVGWEKALDETGGRTLPDGFSIVLGEVVQEPGEVVRSHILRRFPARPDSVWEHLSDPLSIPGLAAVQVRSDSSRHSAESVPDFYSTALENPWIQEYIWPLEWISIAGARPTHGSGSFRFLLLTCRPDAVEFGARWATPGNLGLAASVDPGSQPSQPDRDRVALSVHAIRWFGIPRSFVVVDQGFRSSSRSIAEKLATAERMLYGYASSMAPRDFNFNPTHH
jgi:hypothetical protein